MKYWVVFRVVEHSRELNKAGGVRHGAMWISLITDLVCPQIGRLRSELDIVRGNTKVMSEMLTEMVPGQEDTSDLELLQVTITPCTLPEPSQVVFLPVISCKSEFVFTAVTRMITVGHLSRDASIAW